MSSKEVEDRFNELVLLEKFICSKQELEMFELHGLLVRSGKKFITRTGKPIKIDIIKQKEFEFTENFAELVCKCNALHRDSGDCKIYCMTQELLDYYSRSSLIVEKDGKQYYRKFQNEYWLVYLI